MFARAPLPDALHGSRRRSAPLSASAGINLRLIPAVMPTHFTALGTLASPLIWNGSRSSDGRICFSDATAIGYATADLFAARGSQLAFAMHQVTGQHCDERAGEQGSRSHHPPQVG